VLQVFEVDGTLDDCLAMSAIARAFAELKPWRLSWSGAMNTRTWDREMRAGRRGHPAPVVLDRR
jgi:hypothetical protein